MITRRQLGIGVGLAALTGLGACGAPSGNSSSVPATPGPAAEGFPVSITSALGTTTIPSAPKRVVTLGWGSEDAALALGVLPVGVPVNLSGSSDGLTPWARAKFGSSPPATYTATSDDVPYEKIAALAPDLILAVYSGVTAAQYAKLSAIAPTVGYPDKPWATSWTDQVDIVGRALGLQSQAAAVRAEVSRTIEKQAAAHPEFKGLTAIFGSQTQSGSYNLYLPDDPRMQLLGQLGFTVSDAATTTFTHGAGSPSFATVVSMELLPKLETDVLVAWYFDEKSADAVAKDPVFSKLPAVHDGAYVPITDPALLFATSAPNALSIPWMMASYVPLLSTAAGKAR